MGLKIFGKNIFQIYTHHIMKIDYVVTDKIQASAETSKYYFRPVDVSRLDEELKPIGTTVTVANLRQLIKNSISLVEGFIFGERGGAPIGTIWIMYKGGNDIEYKIRNIDAYIFDVYVNEEHRGSGFAGKMICRVMEHLHQKGIETAYLAVALSNKSAIRAYEKVGFTTVYDKKFARVLKVNVPYHEL